METFRELLDWFCRSRGVFYAELARRVGVTKSYVGQLVHGQSKPPPLARCRQLAEALELGERETQQLLELALRERARPEARRKIEELDAAALRLRSAAARVVAAMVHRWAALPAAAPGTALGELLRDAQEPLDQWLAALPTGRLAEVLERLSETLRAEATRPPTDHGEDRPSSQLPG